jgi:pimeloyl-ACP methyl ester carboxylesterase
MTLAEYGQKARAAAGLPHLHIVPGKHFPQEDQAPAIASQIAEFIRSQQPAAGPDQGPDTAATP